MSKVSIIVPVYNTGTKLKKCLDSLVNQTIKDIEIIIINDGSTDNSEETIKEYIGNYKEQTKDSSETNEYKTQNNSSVNSNSVKIEFYSKENEGIAKTRNYGIEKANSDYILFVDSDDYIDLKLVEKLLPYIEQNIDLIKFKLQRVNENEEILEKTDGPVFEKTTGQEGFNKLYSQDVLLDSPCVYLIKKELFKKNNFTFKRTYHEDFGLMPLVIVSAKDIVSTPYYLYAYVQSANSLMRNDDYNKTLKRIEDVWFHYDNAMNQIEKMNLEKTTKENIKIYYTNAVILKIYELKEEDQKEFIQEIKKRKMYKNIKARNLKQLIKRYLLKFNIKLYIKMR